MRVLILTSLLAVLSAFSVSCSAPERINSVSADTIAEIKITSLPAEIDNSCRNGRAKIFDECADQLEIFARAQAKALEKEKTLLVSFGAEWCIWCHVFDAYINGYVDKFTYTYGEEGSDARDTHTMRERAEYDVSQEAYDLKKYVSENFVVVHIDYEHSTNGFEVIDNAGAWDNFEDFIPYVFSVGEDGQYTASFSHDDVEVRRDTMDWFRGYDRVQLLNQMKAMRQTSLSDRSLP